MKKRILYLMASSLILTACASKQPIYTNSVSTLANADAPIAFNITGKIGITTVAADGKQAGSAFYAWAQQDDRFSIDLTGALGLGATEIRYNGSSATLSSERTGMIRADTPEELLYTATGWQAPISQLPFWIVGRNAPSDTASTKDDQGRLSQATNGDWQANFEYGKNNLPARLRIHHSDGHSVTLTINHQ